MMHIFQCKCRIWIQIKSCSSRNAARECRPVGFIYFCGIPNGVFLRPQKSSWLPTFHPSRRSTKSRSRSVRGERSALPPPTSPFCWRSHVIRPTKFRMKFLITIHLPTRRFATFVRSVGKEKYLSSSQKRMMSNCSPQGLDSSCHV